MMKRGCGAYFFAAITLTAMGNSTKTSGPSKRLMWLVTTMRGPWGGTILESGDVAPPSEGETRFNKAFPTW